ncbi:unnamed protein product [Heterobilharzia americana]|nr:unnamed protein product [Heterobilharzia americana]
MKVFNETDENKAGPSFLSCLADPVWDLLDPLPDIRLLFSSFDTQFFGSTLGAVEVKWSSRMTLCAGVCRFQGRQGTCCISLSEPLLKFRPRKDLVETLLHEMIHAFLFITKNDRDRDDHGPNFRLHMNRINSITGINITVYHSFHDEVDTYRTHWWRCTGPCRDRPPYFGYVKRAMNRVPGPRDTWWGQHQATCTEKQIKGGDIRNFITINFESENTTSQFTSQSNSCSQSSCSTTHIWPSDDKGHILGKSSSPSQNIKPTGFESYPVETVSESKVTCPNCACVISLSLINDHLDICLS